MSVKGCIAIVAVISVGACVDPGLETTTEAVDTRGDPGLGATTQAIVDPCEQEWRCGANSPVINVEGTVGEFHDLELFGQDNAQALSIETDGDRAQIHVNRRSYNLEIHDGRIVARREGVTPVTGGGLLGATIVIESHHVPSNVLRIADVRVMAFPFPAGTTEQVEVYVLEELDRERGTFVNLCANPPYYLLKLSVEERFPELLGMEPNEALVFAGDRIDATAKTMSMDAEPDWFNIGCAGHTLAKLHLTRNTIAAGPPGTAHALQAKRQATFKLLVADYCGTGRSFTVAGVPLQWKGEAGDARDSYFSGIDNLEARWTAEGASCIGEPRLQRSQLPLAERLYPDIQAAIAAECTLQTCTAGDPLLLGGALRVSANPR